MTDDKLSSADIEDIEDLLPTIEQSFGFKFGPTELKNTRTFGELCDIVLSKVQHLDSFDDCTSQQAFYKLRDSIATALQVDKSAISTDTQLLKLLPRHLRWRTVKQIERQLGFKLDILRASYFISIPIVVILLSSIVGLFFIWQYALPGLLLSFGGLKIASYFGNTLHMQTVGQVADKMSTENYLKSRRNPSTVNKKEIENKIRDLFADKLALPKTAMTKDATFV